MLICCMQHHPLASCSGYIDLALVSGIQTRCHKVFAARLSCMHETLLGIGMKTNLATIEVYVVQLVLHNP
jgi:hypothetical protein